MTAFIVFEVDDGCEDSRVIEVCSSVALEHVLEVIQSGVFVLLVHCDRS